MKDILKQYINQVSFVWKPL